MISQGLSDHQTALPHQTRRFNIFIWLLLELFFQGKKEAFSGNMEVR